MPCSDGRGLCAQRSGNFVPAPGVWTFSIYPFVENSCRKLSSTPLLRNDFSPRITSAGRLISRHRSRLNHSLAQWRTLRNRATTKKSQPTRVFDKSFRREVCKMSKLQCPPKAGQPKADTPNIHTGIPRPTMQVETRHPRLTRGFGWLRRLASPQFRGFPLHLE